MVVVMVMVMMTMIWWTDVDDNDFDKLNDVHDDMMMLIRM